MVRVSARLFMASLALLGALGGAAVASPVNYNFAGTVDASAIPTINIGDSFSGTYTFESTTLARAGSTSTTAVFDALKSLSFTISGRTYSSAASQEIRLGNQDGVNELTDRLEIFSSAPGLTGPHIGGGVFAFDEYVVKDLTLRFDDPSGTIFSSALDLPTNVSLLDFATNSFVINFDELFVGDPPVSGTLTAFGPAPIGVPEPMTLSIFALGVAGLAAMRRRKAKA